MSTNKIFTSAVIVFVLCVALFFITQLFSTSGNTIVVSDPGAIAWAPFHVAVEQGIFAHHGINIQVVSVQTGDESLKALVSNSVDISLAGLVPYAFLALEHPEIKVFAQTTDAHDNYIIARRGSGITSPADLKSKKIGYAKTTSSEITIANFLTRHHLEKSDVTLVPLKPLAMPTALASGQIDAYSMWEPHVINGRKLLGIAAVVFDEASDTYTWQASLMAHDAFIKDHHALLAQFLAAWKEAEQFIHDHPDEAIAISSKYTHISADALKSVWHKYNFSVGITKETLDSLSTNLAWANTHRAQPVQHVPEASTLLDSSILNDVAQ